MVPVATKGFYRRYWIQYGVLTSVSPKLAAHWDCVDQDKRKIDDGLIRIFIAWLLSRTIPDTAKCQATLASAWNFGLEYEIPAFQDAVMCKLAKLFGMNDLSPAAVLEAYKVKSGTHLQRALVAQLAIDMLTNNADEWSKATFAEKFEKAPGFLIDLIKEMPKLQGTIDFGAPWIKAEDFLVLGVGQ